MKLLVGFVLALVPLATATNYANETYSADSGVIYSVNYPNDYYNNMKYFMTISVSSGNYVYLTLLDFLTEDCCDKLTIWDGRDVTASPLAVLSGDLTGANYSSKSNVMTLMFSTDLVDTYRGFAIKYEEVQDNTSVKMTNQCAPQISQSSVGFITSPNWPSNYPNNASCQYLLSVKDKGRVKLQFVAFLTEDCCDKVYLYDGTSVQDPLIAVLAGGISLSNATFYSTGNSMFVTFNSDFTTNFTGFSAFYVTA